MHPTALIGVSRNHVKDGPSQLPGWVLEEGLVSRKWVHVTGTWFLCFFLSVGCAKLEAIMSVRQSSPLTPRPEVFPVLWPLGQRVSPTHTSHGSDPGSADLPLPVGSCYEAAVF